MLLLSEGLEELKVVLPSTTPPLLLGVGLGTGWGGGVVWVAGRAAGQGGDTVLGGQALEISVVCSRMGGVWSRRLARGWGWGGGGVWGAWQRASRSRKRRFHTDGKKNKKKIKSQSRMLGGKCERSFLVVKDQNRM